ncbi:Branched-chain alpha-ketoacid dehydrogenase kinase/Pyruvate dehydrogenase kinase [Trypanosoma melophagium]|uniref:Branched-chain alpha-ketoacid dehydrogenase kinase/Pyruvate dehydrogenase kinase n=1 Tax=Trypanosoma melophagium TaxID=715481 RepID=UPI00351A1647|nr:Branched-chain alpha-ketoacid dehydrogenase kinase/Pyruvate dehydrogenase kinase [Trypanosoma melophagium]
MRRFSSFLRVCLPLTRWKSDTTEVLKEELGRLTRRVEAIEDSKAVQALVSFYSSRPVHKLNSFDEVIHYCSRPDYNAEVFCHVELPVLLSHIIKALDNLPCGLNAMPSVLLVKNTYLNSFKKLIECDFPGNSESIKHFRNVVSEIEKLHRKRDILVTMAMGLLELKELLLRHRQFLFKVRKIDTKTTFDYLLHEGLVEITEPMDSFSLLMVHYNFLSRMLINLDREADNKVGMVDLEIDLERLVRNSVDDAKQICTDHYGDCPDVKFIISKDAGLIKFAHMSSTISYIVLELMKNAFRATVEAHMERDLMGIINCENMPPVEVLVNMKEYAKHACICISDEGLGMTETQANMAMTYAYTSVKRPLIQFCDDGESIRGDAVAPLAGYGFGLPMSRVYARTFDGDLVMSTMEGYGTRMYYYIKL